MPTELILSMGMFFIYLHPQQMVFYYILHMLLAAQCHFLPISLSSDRKMYLVKSLAMTDFSQCIAQLLLLGTWFWPKRRVIGKSSGNWAFLSRPPPVGHFGPLNWVSDIEVEPQQGVCFVLEWLTRQCRVNHNPRTSNAN